MNDRAHNGDQIATSWQLRAGIGIFVLSIAIPVTGIPLVAALSLSTAATASVSEVLLVGASINAQNLEHQRSGTGAADR